LVVTDAFDERLDLYKSTRAAARYLRDLHIKFGDWSLSLAAYNAGEEAVEHAINRASSRDFHSIVRAGVLPVETGNYVPAVVNAIGLMKNAANSYLTTRPGKSPIGAVVYAADRLDKPAVYE
jgi:membrane-bound lytic murein transglycosylase D